jgi:acyl carrier protein
MPVPFSKWHEVYPTAATMPLLADLVLQPKADADGVRHKSNFDVSTIMAAEDGERERLVEASVLAAVCRTMGIPEAKLDRHLSLSEHGLDSLMAFSLNNCLKAELGITLPIQRFLKGPSVAELAKDALQQILLSSLTDTRSGTRPDEDWEVLAI